MLVTAQVFMPLDVAVIGAVVVQVEAQPEVVALERLKVTTIKVSVAVVVVVVVVAVAVAVVVVVVLVLVVLS